MIIGVWLEICGGQDIVWVLPVSKNIPEDSGSTLRSMKNDNPGVNIFIECGGMNKLLENGSVKEE